MEYILPIAYYFRSCPVRVLLHSYFISHLLLKIFLDKAHAHREAASQNICAFSAILGRARLPPLSHFILFCCYSVTAAITAI
jgi:hypothetical protein